MQPSRPLERSIHPGVVRKLYAEPVGKRGYRRRLAPEDFAGKMGKASNYAGLRFI